MYSERSWQQLLGKRQRSVRFSLVTGSRPLERPTKSVILHKLFSPLSATDHRSDNYRLHLSSVSMRSLDRQMMRGSKSRPVGRPPVCRTVYDLVPRMRIPHGVLGRLVMGLHRRRRGLAFKREKRSVGWPS